MADRIDISGAIALAERLAAAAAAEIRPRFRQGLPADRKSDLTPVTEADRAAERAIRVILAAERSNDGIAGEEYGVSDGSSGLTWVIDPVDGTTAFITGRPSFVTLIALLDGDTPVLGLIDQPIVGDRWLGVAGRPTLFNGQAVRTRLCARLEDAAFSTTGPHLFKTDEPVYRAISQEAGSRTYGGDGYAYGLLAAGWIDVVLEAGLKLHDFAALVPVIEGAAGGIVTDWAGAPLRRGSDGQVLATGDAALHGRVLERIDGVRRELEYRPA